jgi:hypothetical protein
LGEGAGAEEHVEAVAAASVRELEAAALTPGQIAEHADISYGAKADDFYPTAKVGKPDRKK